MAANVADLCRQLAMSEEDLAERSGLDPQRVRAILMGRWTPSPAERKQVAEALGTAVEEIAWGHLTPIQHLYGHGPG